MRYWWIIGALVFGIGVSAWGHCDGMDGPVVKSGTKALEAGNVNPALAWVQKEGEAEVKEAFARTMAVRKLSPEAKELADRYFFETLVRVHRAGEGEPYMGLKPAGRDLGPAIPAADRALESGSPEEVTRLLTTAVQQGVERRLAEAREAKGAAGQDVGDVEKGRRFVRAYVTFLRYVEGAYQAAAAAGEGEKNVQMQAHEGG